MANYSDIKYQAAGSATAIYADMAALIAATGMSAGDQALVTALNKVFMYTGTAWYLVATMTNASPTAITGVSGSYDLATDGTATTITAVSTDPEGFALTWSYAVTTGSLGSTATVSQADNVFTITPSSTPADGGSFSITFSVTDGATGAVNAVSAFTLAFIVTDTRYTALSVKATATGSNQTFDDASTSNHTITVAGDTTASTFSPYRHGGYAVNFDGTNDFLTVPDSTDFNIAGDADFTLELWGFYRSFATQSHFVDTRPSQGLYLTGSVGGGGANDGKVKIYINGYFRIITASTVPLNSWVHIALVRNSGTMKVYINGTVDSNTYSDTNAYIAGDWIIGKRSPSISAGSYMEGLFSDYRFVNGTAVYTSNFTPPTEPLTAITNTKILLGNLPYLKDQSTSNHTITVGGNASLEPKSVFDNGAYSESSHGASAYFDGSGDRLTIAGNSDFAFGTGDFSISCWIYFKDLITSGYESIIDARNSGTDTGAWQLGINSNAGNALKIMFSIQSSGSAMTPILISNTDTIINQWYYISVSRTGTTSKLHLNGTEVASNASDSTNYSVVPASIHAGSTWSGSHRLNGYLSDIRVVKGTGLSDYTTPTAPLTAITNTKFLLNPETSISDLSQGNALKCIGNAATSTTQVKFAGTRSIYLDGTGDYITAAEDDASFSFGTGDFTVECWLYHQNASALYYDLVATASNANYIGSNRGGWIFGYYHTHSSTYALKFGYQYNNAFVHDINFSKTLNADTWYHIALTRQGNQLKCFADGIQVGSTVTNSTNIISTEPLTIGTGATVTSQYVTGYMQDIRVTKGLARYTANFTPPTAELEG